MFGDLQRYILKSNKMKITICLRCKKVKKCYAKGLCEYCYKHYRQNNVCLDCSKSITDKAVRCHSCSNRKYKTKEELEKAKKERYERNREKSSAYNKDYYRRNKERISLYKKEWFQARKNR